jgi:hypothetical protein
MMNQKRYVASLLIMSTLAITGCRDLGTTPEVRVPSSIQLMQSSVRLGSLGERTAIEAMVFDQLKEAMPTVALQFVVEDPAVIMLSPSGEIQARSNGETTVHVRVEGNGGRPTLSGYRAGIVEAAVRVIVRQEVGSVALGSVVGDGSAPMRFRALGQRRAVPVEVRDPLGTLFARDVEIQLTSQAPGVVEVLATGELRAVEDGTGVVEIMAEGVSTTFGVEVRSSFSYAACVSSKASRMHPDSSATRLNVPSGSPPGAVDCDRAQVRAVMGLP